MSKKEAWTKERKMLQSVSKSIANAVCDKVRELYSYTEFPVNKRQNIAQFAMFMDKNRPLMMRFVEDLSSEKLQETSDRILRLRGIKNDTGYVDGESDDSDTSDSDTSTDIAPSAGTTDGTTDTAGDISAGDDASDGTEPPTEDE
jgi:hypothetical protein